jgi:hypothetical protein
MEFRAGSRRTFVFLVGIIAGLLCCVSWLVLGQAEYSSHQPIPQALRINNSDKEVTRQLVSCSEDRAARSVEIAASTPSLPEVARERAVTWCRIVDRESGRPVSGASITFRPNGTLRPGPVSDSEGFLFADAEGASEYERARGLITSRDSTSRAASAVGITTKCLARIDAPAFASVTITLAPGHEVQSLAQIVELSRGATLRIRAFDVTGALISHLSVIVDANYVERFLNQAGGIPYAGSMTVVGDFGGARIRPEPGFLTQRWTAATDASGSCDITALPSDVELRVSSDGVPGRPPELLGMFQESHVVLQPGEVREIQWRESLLHELRGILRDQHGRPVANQEIITVLQTPREVADARYFTQLELVYAHVESNMAGEFSCKLPTGNWYIGPAREQGEYWPSDDAIAGSGELVTVGGFSLQPHLFSATRGVFISGNVVSSAGQPLSNMIVKGYSEERVGAFEAETGFGGAFSLGPLIAGDSLRLTGGDSEEWLIDDSLVVSAGASDIILRAVPAARIDGQLWCAAHPVLGVGATANCETKNRTLSAIVNEDTGQFALVGLPSGRCQVFVCTEDRRSAVVSCELRGGECKSVRVELFDAYVVHVERTQSGPAEVSVRNNLGEFYKRQLRMVGPDCLYLPRGGYELTVNGDSRGSRHIQLPSMSPSGEEQEVIVRW